MQELNYKGKDGNGQVGGSILYSFWSAISMVCANFPIVKVENNIRTNQT